MLSVPRDTEGWSQKAARVLRSCCGLVGPEDSKTQLLSGPTYSLLVTSDPTGLGSWLGSQLDVGMGSCAMGLPLNPTKSKAMAAPVPTQPSQEALKAAPSPECGNHLEAQEYTVLHLCVHTWVHVTSG